MRTEHLEILVEEPSMEAFLGELLPRLLGERASFTLHPHRGKNDLLTKLRPRLLGYAAWLPESWRIVVVLDRDDDNCDRLKQQMEETANGAGLRTASAVGAGPWRIANRIAIEELEAWYFGDWCAVRECYPGVSATVPMQVGCQDPDAIAGGTWEALERILQRAGHFRSGLRKLELARAIGRRIEAARNSSHSFQVFHETVLNAVTCS
jgi:hypothetical protein